MFLPRYLYWLLLIPFTVLMLSCGGDDIEYSNLISGIDEDSFLEIGDYNNLPGEHINEEITWYDRTKMKEWGGKWNQTLLNWAFSPEKSLNLKNGLLEIHYNYVPPKLFRFHLAFRNSANASCILEVYNNKVKLVERYRGKFYNLCEYPLYFKDTQNTLKIFFIENVISLYFNNELLGTVSGDRKAMSGTVNDIWITSQSNYGRNTGFYYVELDSSDSSKTALDLRTFNSLIDPGSGDFPSNLLRNVRIGDITIPSIITPPPSRFSIPVRIDSDSNLRFSIANFPVITDDKARIEFRVEYLENGDDNNRHVLFTESIKPVHVLDWEWMNCLVELEKYKGTTGDLVFSTKVINSKDGESDNIFPLWGAPRILSKTPSGKHSNVVLITIENLGLDALELRKEEGFSASSILNYANNSVLFRAAYPQSIWIPASLYSILTGYSYSHHHFINGNFKDKYKFSEDISTLAEFLRKQGYETAAFVQGLHAQPFFGLYEGYNEYYTSSRYDAGPDEISNSRKLVDLATLWMERRIGKKVFLHLHFDVLSQLREENLEVKNNKKIMPGEFWQEYSRETEILDGYIGRFLRSMWKIGATQNSIVIITGVDGMDVPSAIETGLKSRSRDNYLRVPLIINVQSKFPPQGIKEMPVSISYIYDTVKDLIELEGKEKTNSLKRILDGETNITTDMTQVTSTSFFSPLYPYPAYVLRDERLKLFYFAGETDEKNYFYYDLLNDPNELRLLTGIPRDKKDRLDRYLNNQLEEKEYSWYYSKDSEWARHYLKILDDYRKAFYSD